MFKLHWKDVKAIRSKSFKCCSCDYNVVSDKGYYAQDSTGQVVAYIYICPHCTAPTFFNHMGTQIPGASFGKNIDAIPNDDLRKLYDEMRGCVSSNNYTASVLCCRKMLMNIAVLEGAKEGDTYKSYVDYLESKGFIPPNCKDLVDYIREIGNIANHEIKIMNEADAKTLVDFITMLLDFIYTYPALKNKYLKNK